MSETPAFLRRLPAETRRSVDRILRLTELSIEDRLARIGGKVSIPVLRKCKEYLEEQEEDTEDTSSSEEASSGEEYSSEEDTEEGEEEDEEDEEENEEEEEEEEEDDSLEQFRSLAQSELDKLLVQLERKTLYFEGLLREAERKMALTLEKAVEGRVNFNRKMLREEAAFTDKPISNFLLGYAYVPKVTKKPEDNLQKADEGIIRECIICTEQYPESEMIVCTAMKEEDEGSEPHFVCTECVRGNTEANKVDGKIADDGTGWPCYSVGCQRIILWAHIRVLLEEATVTHLEKRFDAAALREFDDKMEYCKTCNFGAFLDRGPHIMKWFSCINPDCKAVFCRICKIDQQLHIGKTCDEADPVRKAAKEKKHKLTELEEFLSAAKVRICTKCKKHFTKDADGSCNKMTCSECGTTMCYICKQSNISYEHFGDGRCTLFTDTVATDRLLYDNAVQEARKDPHMNELLEELQYQPT